MAGFYIPPQVLTQEEFKKAAAAFVSPDGHAVRYLIQTKLNPFSTAAMDQVNSITDTARGAQPNTALADASISMAGYPATLRDMRDYYNHDIRFIIAMTIIVVLLILIALLRAIVAPLYLIASVVISYLSALGIGVIVFQLILGQELHWSVPGLTFIVLVAVGADYNMLLISRIRDESPHGMRSGVIRTVGSTGGVITSGRSHLRRLDVRSAVRQHQHHGPGRFRHRDRAAAGYLPGAHHHGAGHGRAGRPGKLVAVTIGAAAALTGWAGSTGAFDRRGINHSYTRVGQACIARDPGAAGTCRRTVRVAAWGPWRAISRRTG